MAEISLHAIDVTRAVPAGGMRVVVRRLGDPGETIADSRLGPAGTLVPVLTGLAPGIYEAEFHVADYYRGAGVDLPDPAFLGVAPFRFGIAGTAAHYHLPLKFTPWGFSLFRGG